MGIKNVKNVLAATNPFAWALGIPVTVGIMLSAMLYNTFDNTIKIFKSFKD